MSRRLDEENHLRIRKNILKKLYAYKAFSKGHLLFERLLSGIPSHFRGWVAEVLAKLIKEDLVRCYGKTLHGKAYQLNLDKLEEIEQIIFGANPKN